MDTPLIIKQGDEQPWSKEGMFYMLTADGLFLCRNHEWFVSSVKTDEFPDDLARHKPFLRMRYPKLSKELFEQVVGFFHIVAQKHKSEAIVLMAHHTSGRIAIVVPEQTVSPAHAEYDMPGPLGQGWRWLGDIHSHVEMSAFSSFTDESDEVHRPGVHIVVGKIDMEPPEFHTEVVVDGTRFRVNNITDVVEGYQGRRPDLVPEEWMIKVERKVWPAYKPWKHDKGEAIDDDNMHGPGWRNWD